MNVARIPKALLALLVLAAALPALAAPARVALVPPDGARFLAYQRFDVRVEGQGTGPYSATLAVDGVPQTFTSGAQNTTSTDGITSAGWGGFNLRGFSSAEPGWHTLTATFSDATGSVTKTSRFEVVNAFGRRGERGGDTGKPAKNIIIMLGDGMGVAHRTAARLVKYGVTAGQPDGYLEMDRFPGTGLVTTHSLNSIITDSAPGMACYSTGSHANNGQEGVYPAQVTNPFFAPRVEYMAEYLHRVKGTSLGLVTTADVEDATPAANAVHTANRNAGTGVCDQYLDESDAGGTGLHGTGLTVLMGGGRRWFLPSTAYGSSRSAGTDYPPLPTDLVSGWGLPAAAAGGLDPSRDLIAGFEAAGFKYADSKAALDALIGRHAPDRLLGLFGYGNMNVALDKINKRRGVKATRPDGTQSFIVDDYQSGDQPMLDEMAEAALKVLSRNENGFVLMVEGAHIDKQSHLMDADRAIGETIEFDAAVGVARRWADKLGDTVVVVLADHECSGFSLVGALLGGIGNLKELKSTNTTTIDLTKQLAHQNVVGTYDAAGFPRYVIQPDGYPATMDIDSKMLVGFGANGDRFESWLSKPLPVIDSLLPGSLSPPPGSGLKGSLAAAGYAASPAGRPEAANGMLLRGQVPGDQAVHTAADIPISAYSTGNRAWTLFAGVQTNTDVYFKLMRAVLAGARDDDRPDRE
jgi:alkaline phosphatase